LPEAIATTRRSLWPSPSAAWRSVATSIARAGAIERTLGLLRGGEQGLRDLRDAVDAFAHSPARLEQGWASSLKTVEMHLGNAYRKLDISSRVELPAVLGGAVSAARPRSRSVHRFDGRG